MAYIVVHKRQINGATVGIVNSRHKTRAAAEAQIYNDTSYVVEMAICPTTRPGAILDYAAGKRLAQAQEQNR